MMNKPRKFSRVFLGALGLVAIVSIAMGLFWMQGVYRAKPKPVYSADGSKLIIASVNSNKSDPDYLLVKLEIRDRQSGKNLLQAQTRASDRMRWSVEWLDNTTVRLDSSDIGLYCWREGSDLGWAETKCP
jgi:hypothetical protein